MDTDKHNGRLWRKRAVIAAGVAVVGGWVIGAPKLLSLGGTALEFEPLPELSPFRRLTNAGAPTVPNVALIGLDAPRATQPGAQALRAEVRSDLCRALFGPDTGGPVPVAKFTDFNCPICRAMETRLQNLRARAPNSFRLIRHQLPILGANSLIASRAVIAAEHQGAYEVMHARLQRSPVVTDLAYVNRIARDIGLNLPKFQSDLTSTGTNRQLGVSRALADLFGFYGTPAFAVGHTIFVGALAEDTLGRLIAEESHPICSPTG